MTWVRFHFTRRDGVWHIGGPLADLRAAREAGKPILVGKRDRDVYVTLTGQIIAEKHGGICAEWITKPDDWNPEDQPLSPGDAVDTVRCPACGVEPGEPCTQATSSGRVKVGWVHNSRRDLAHGWR